jgi:hypothetical protein
MMNKNIQEEILRQLQLINFDRSRTLNENKQIKGKLIINITESKEKFTPPNVDLSVLGDTLPPGAKETLIRQAYVQNLTPEKVLKQQQQQKKYDKEHPCRIDSYIDNEPNYYNTVCRGRSAFYRLNFQVEGDGTWFSSWGTDEDEVIESLKMLKTREDYEDLRWWINKQTGFPMTVLEWLQANEFSTASFGSSWSGKYFSLNPGQWYQYNTNDYYLAELYQILRKFSADEKFESEMPEDTWEFMLPPATREALHVVLPLATLAITIITGGAGAMTFGTYLLNFGIEVLDSAIYYYADKDNYAAGLSLVFAFVSPFDAVLRNLVGKVGSSLIYKLATNTGDLTDEEFDLIMLNSRNFAKYEKLAKLGMRVSAIRMTIQRLANMNDLVRFFSWMVAKGYMVASLVSNILLTIGIGFLSWEKINDMYFKFCNSMELKQMEKSKTWILQKLSALGPYLQPYSSPCSDISEKEIIAKTINEYSDIKSFLKIYFEKIISGNIELNLERGDLYLKKDVAYFQYVLYYLGYDYKAKPIEDIRKKIQKKEGKYTKQQCQDMMQNMLIGGYDMVKVSAHPECDEYLKPSLKITKQQEKELSDLTSKKPVNVNYEFDYGIKIPYQWGTFDEQTKLMLSEFQKKYGLNQTGTFNKDTAKKMFNLLNNGSLAKIQDYGKLSNDVEDIEFLKQKAQENADFLERTLTKEEIQFNKNMNKQKFEEAKSKLDKEFEKNEYTPTEFPNYDDDTITVNISKYDPDSDGITNVGFANQFMKK